MWISLKEKVGRVWWWVVVLVRTWVLAPLFPTWYTEPIPLEVNHAPASRRSIFSDDLIRGFGPEQMFVQRLRQDLLDAYEPVLSSATIPTATAFMMSVAQSFPENASINTQLEWMQQQQNAAVRAMLKTDI